MTSITEQNATSYDEHAIELDKNLEFNIGHCCIEKPSMYAQLPESLMGKSVLSIGVGSGRELREILSRRPARVIAIDISQRLMELAKQRHPDVQYRLMDMMQLGFESESFDYVFASQSLHYASDWDVLFKSIYRLLRPGGELLFSTLNPTYWDSKHKTGRILSNERGVKLTELEFMLTGNIRVIFYNHEDIDAIKNTVTYAGFEIENCFNPPIVPLRAIPTEQELKDYAIAKETNTVTPYFLIIKARRPYE